RPVPALHEHLGRVPVGALAGQVAPAFQHQHACAGRGEPVREGAAARAGADDDDVVVPVAGHGNGHGASSRAAGLSPVTVWAPPARPHHLLGVIGPGPPAEPGPRSSIVGAAADADSSKTQSAQMTRIPMAMPMTDQPGWWDTERKHATTLAAARTMPATRPPRTPAITNMPASPTSAPRPRWTHPHVAALRENTLRPVASGACPVNRVVVAAMSCTTPSSAIARPAKRARPVARAG